MANLHLAWPSLRALVIVATASSCLDPANNLRRSLVEPASITLVPSAATILPHETTRFRATLFDSSGNFLTELAVTWHSSDTTTARVDPTGVVVALREGEVEISAKGGTAVAIAHVDVAEAILVGAGDIAACRTSTEATAEILDHISGTVFTAGDNTYPIGAPSEFANCYDPTWGRHKARTMPAPGNHDYLTTGAAGYYQYFGARAGDPGKGYYSYDLGTWHVIVLNTNIDVTSRSPQLQWLRDDLASHPSLCTIAYWHHPTFTSGTELGNPWTLALWQALYDAGADVVVSGHDHDYERFAPQDPQAVLDSLHGIREFVVGTGGASHLPFGPRIAPNSEVRDNSTFGVLQLALHQGGYAWTFVPVRGQTFSDSGTGRCH